MSTGTWIAFACLAALTLIPALFVVQSRNIVHAGYWLLPCLVGVAGLFAMLEAHFLFVVQLLIYAGAIMVLILFALMLTQDVMNPRVPQTNRYGLWAGLLCAVMALGIGWTLTRQPWVINVGAPADATNQVRHLGLELITSYAVPFEVSSLLLLAALIGAIVLAKSEREPAPEVPPLAVEEIRGDGQAPPPHVAAELPEEGRELVGVGQ